LSITASSDVAEAPGQPHLAAGRGGGAQIGAGLDAVGHDAMRGAVQRIDPLDADHVAARAGNARAHGDQAIGEIDHFRLARRVLDHGFALRQAGRHHQVLGTGHGHHVGEQAGTFQPCSAGMDITMLDGNLGTHRGQALDVLVHRPRADGATAGQRNPGLAGTGHQRPEHQDRGAHGLDHFVGCHGIVQPRCIQRHRIAGADF
jgi:hypothetical protein